MLGMRWQADKTKSIKKKQIDKKNVKKYLSVLAVLIFAIFLCCIAYAAQTIDGDKVIYTDVDRGVEYGNSSENSVFYIGDYSGNTLYRYTITGLNGKSYSRQYKAIPESAVQANGFIDPSVFQENTDVLYPAIKDGQIRVIENGTFVGNNNVPRKFDPLLINEEDINIYTVNNSAFGVDYYTEDGSTFLFSEQQAWFNTHLAEVYNLCDYLGISISLRPSGNIFQVAEGYAIDTNMFLAKMNADGTIARDSNGNPIPATYCNHLYQNVNNNSLWVGETQIGDRVYQSRLQTCSNCWRPQPYATFNYLVTYKQVLYSKFVKGYKDVADEDYRQLPYTWTICKQPNGANSLQNHINNGGALCLNAPFQQFSGTRHSTDVDGGVSDHTEPYAFLFKTHAERYNIQVDANYGTINNNYPMGGGTSTYSQFPVEYDSYLYDNIGGLNPTREGYTFAGWWTDRNGGTQLYDANGYRVNNTGYWSNGIWKKDLGTEGNWLVLYAHWIPNNYTLTLDHNGGKYNNATSNNYTVTFDSGNYTDISWGKPSKTGYTFQGWFTAKTGGTPVFDLNGYAVQSGGNTTYWKGGSAWSSDWMGGCYHDWNNMTWNHLGNVTLYAQWKPIPYKQVIQVRYQNADGTWGAYSTVINQNYDYDTTVSWSVGQTWSHKAASVSYTVTGEKTTKVDVERRTYTLKFVKGDTNISSIPADQSCLAGNTLSATSTAKTGYHLTKYSGTLYDGSGTGTWTDCNELNSHTSSWTMNADRTITVYSAANTYYVSYVKGLTNNGGTTSTSTHTYDADVTLRANGFTGRSYSLAFKENKPKDDKGVTTAGTVTNLQTTKSSTLSFKNWYITDAHNNNKTNASANTNIGKKNYRNDHKGTASATAQWNSVTLKDYSTPSLKGYKFNGYYTAATGGTKTTTITVEAAATAYSNTLYAQWTPITYKVRFNGNNNWNTSQGSYTQTLTYDTHTALTPNKFTRPNNATYNDTLYKIGYEFVGWGTSPNQTTPTYTDGQIVNNLTATDGEIIDLYAIWKKTVTLTINFNGGKFNNNGTSKVLSYTMYNSELNHTFDIKDYYGTPTGTDYYDKGLNNNLTKTVSGVQQRFLDTV